MKLPNPYALENAQFSGTHNVVSLDTSNVFKGQEMLYKTQAKQIADGVKRVGAIVGSVTGAAGDAKVADAGTSIDTEIDNVTSGMNSGNHGSSNYYSSYYDRNRDMRVP